MKRYRLFISHSWRYDYHYNRLLNLLDAAEDFDYEEYAVPEDAPAHNEADLTALRELIRQEMEPASCVVIMAGIYSAYSKWINLEVELAKEMNKKIIAIRPYESQKISELVAENADAIAYWCTDSIIGKIKAIV